MKTVKIIIVIGTLILIGVIMNPVDNPDVPNVTNMDAFGRTIFSLIVVAIGIALWRAADKEQDRLKS